MQNHDEIIYQEAVKRVKKIKSFYTHAAVYVVINIMLLIVKFQKMNADESFFEFENFSTIIFWGIGLAAHGLSVFLPSLIFGKDWEERKLNEFMEKDKNQKWE